MAISAYSYPCVVITFLKGRILNYLNQMTGTAFE